MSQHIPDALVILACLLVTTGVALWSIPAALIVAGMCAASIAIYLAVTE